MTSQYATDALVKDLEAHHYLRTDAQQVPYQGQVPKSNIIVTATGAIPSRCPNVVIISGAAPITLTATSLANLCGRTVTFCSDGTNAVQHIVTLPANSIGGALRTITFAANAGASATLTFFYNGAAFRAVVVGTVYQAVLS